MQTKRARAAVLGGLAAIVLAVMAGLAGSAAAAPGDATVNVTVQVDPQGQVTAKAVNPQVVTIKAASQAGVADGGRVKWNFTANQMANGVTVKVIFDSPEGSPFPLGNTFSLANIVLTPNNPNVLDSGQTNKVGGVYHYRVEVKQGNNVFGGEAEVQIASAVGGTSDLRVSGGSPASASGSGSSSAPYTVIAGGLAAALLAASAGGWYARRRWRVRP